MSNFQEVKRNDYPYIMLTLLPTYIFVGGLFYIAVKYLRFNYLVGAYLIVGAFAYASAMKHIMKY